MLIAEAPFCVPPEERMFLADAGEPTVFAPPALPFEKEIVKSGWERANWSAVMLVVVYAPPVSEPQELELTRAAPPTLPAYGGPK
jgi:hypothetical protein